MARLTTERCYRLDVSTLQDSIARGWRAASITWTLNRVQSHPHSFNRIEAADGGKVLLVYDTIHHGRQRMMLTYETVHTSAGTTRVYWRCPGCERRINALYRPPGGEYFLCRHCWNLAYPSQFETPRMRAKGREDALWDALFFGVRPRRRLPGTLGTLDGALDALWTILEKATDNAPGCKRPGRPREKRPYRRRYPLAELSPHTDEHQAYCPRCRDRREILHPTPVVFRSGRPAVQGQCAVCQATMARIVKRDDFANRDASGL